MTTVQRRCKSCNDVLTGRIDQKFCSAYCKSAYHYQKGKEKQTSLFSKIDRQLKMNRRILKSYNKACKSTVRREVLVNEGFNPNYFTHYWKNKNNQVYLFCYEFGFLSINESNQPKYLLVRWQSYMGSF